MIELTGHTAPRSRWTPRYRRDAEYGQEGSTAHSRQRSAAPAGRFSRRKCRSEPKLETRSIRLPVT
ncbi:hypothetical protein [Amycolatopsis thermoflava]|uniref:Uncharacterized protein n=1 Tax=Amycolatopsis dongchuanensis TaxID=1070866 RepID=A0ABP8VME1_9PSEU